MEVLICADDGKRYYVYEPTKDTVYCVHPYMLMKPE